MTIANLSDFCTMKIFEDQSAVKDRMSTLIKLAKDHKFEWGIFFVLEKWGEGIRPTTADATREN